MRREGAAVTISLVGIQPDYRYRVVEEAGPHLLLKRE
jgi:hypothetical protein